MQSYIYKQKISIQINDSIIKQADCVKYLGVYLVDKLSWNRHIEHIETKLSAATGALYKLRKYISQNSLMLVYYSLAYSHLQYAIICWGNTSKTIKRSLQVKKNHIVKIICNKFGKKTRLKPLYDKLRILNINKIYKLKVAKFMTKVSLNKLPIFCDVHLMNFKSLSSMHTYPTQNALSNNFFTYIHKALTSSYKTTTKILKLHYLQS